MFDKNKFALILKKISDTYENQREFAEKSDINRTYLSQYMNMKLQNPPKPEILQRLADASNNVTNYSELMEICGYIENNYSHLKTSLENELYKFNLTEDDYHDAINCFMHDSQNIQSLAFSLKYSPNFANKEIEKEKQVLLTILNYVFAFIPNDLALSNNEEKFYNEFNKALIPAKKMLLSLNKDNIIHKASNKQFYMCPVYGRISAGEPNWAEEFIEGKIPLDTDLMGIVNPEEHFFLRVNGESMNRIIKNGSFALIHKQDMVNDGEIAVVLVNGYDATLKKFTRQGEFVILEPMSDDSSFTMQVYNKDTQIQILGKYIGKMEINN